jgi:hypothetical protein
LLWLRLGCGGGQPHDDYECVCDEYDNDAVDDDDDFYDVFDVMMMKMVFVMMMLFMMMLMRTKEPSPLHRKQSSQTNLTDLQNF